MSFTFNDMKELLKKENELDLLEILDLSSVELVDLLEDVLYDKQSRIREYYCEDDNDEEWTEEESY